MTKVTLVVPFSVCLLFLNSSILLFKDKEKVALSPQSFYFSLLSWYKKVIRIIMEDKGYILRRWKLTDTRRLAENANNINIWNNVRDYFPHPYSEKDAKVFINMTLQSKQPSDFAIVINDEAAGGIGFIQGKDVERLNAEIGYWLGEKYWGKGIMTNVLKDVADYIFTNTEIIRLFTCVFEYNIGSMKVLEKSGFRKVGVFKNAAIKNGKIIDMHYYELIKDSE